MKEGKGVDVPFPVDQEGAEYLFFPAVSDYLMEADTLMGNAAVFRATGDSWTIGTGYFDGINYGLFYNDQILEHVLQKVHAEAERLKVKKILIGECGHASRTAKVLLPDILRRKASAAGRQHHGVHAQGMEGGPSEAQAERDHREGHLPRSVQLCPPRLDRGAAARTVEGLLQRITSR